MACFKPLKAFRAPHEGSPILFKAPSSGAYVPLKLPCGQCVGCRLERSRQWAVRCTHEAQMHENNCFVTLTYDDACIPEGRTLVKKDFQDFMKRLRDRLEYPEFKYYMCGEYGEQFGRPHYHANFFGLDFFDREFYKLSPNGHKIYTSKLLDDIWGRGICTVGAFSFETAAYTARYVMKKVTGDVAVRYYEYVDADGVVHDRLPDYNDMSRRGGIGKSWLAKFEGDVYPRDHVIINGVRARTPRYYDNIYDVNYPSDMKVIKRRRRLSGFAHRADNTPDRLKVREEIVVRKLKHLKREL